MNRMGADVTKFQLIVEISGITLILGLVANFEKKYKSCKLKILLIL